MIGSATAGDKYTLEEPVDDERVYGVGLRLDVQGKVQTRGPENKNVDLPLTGTAALSYRERRLLGIGTNSEGLRSIRDYENGQVDIDVADEKTQVILPDALKLIVAQGKPSGLEVYSLGGLLTAQEVELLSPPTDSLGLIALLPTSPVEVGEEWTPPKWVGQFLARLEASTKNEVKCKLVSVEDEVAKITFHATVHGAVQGAPTELSITGTIDFHLTQKCITAADVQQTEKRTIGAVSVGLDVAARMRLLRKVAQVGGRIATPAVLTAAGEEHPASALLLRFEAPGNLSMLHTRQWHLFKQTEQTSILRLLDDGLFIAQVNMSPIPSAKPGEHTTPEVFEGDIRQSLGERLKAITKSEVLPSKDRRYIYKVVAEGAVGDRQLTWIYYLVADPTGKQASMLFSLDRELVEKLGQRDQDLVESLRFGPPPVTAILKAPPAR
ncbi:MAG: hypothetical protein Q8K78_00545 [Planctomycetaceae bacterium]|nr:hypothetical protein [Planctomycetaceae bacterium]